MDNYSTTHEEKDHKIIIYLKLVCDLLPSNPHRNKVIIRSLDSDVLIKLFYYAHYFLELRLLMDTETGDARRLLAVTKCARGKGQQLCKSLPGFYVFTGEDTTSAFKGKGCVQPYKKLPKYPRSQAAFRQLGLRKELLEETFEELGAFTCVMYGATRASSVDKVRAVKLKEMAGKTLRIKKKRMINLGFLHQDHACFNISNEFICDHTRKGSTVLL